MSDRPQTVDRSTAGGPGDAGGQPDRDASRAPAEQAGGPERVEAHESASPPAQPHAHDAASGDDGKRAQQAPEAPARDADEDALRGDVDELVAAAAQRDEYLALAQRTQADFENYRKRVAKESAAAQERGLIKLAQELLPALDNLDRALAEAGGDEGEDRDEGEGRDEALLEGVRLVRSELHAA